MDVPVPEAEVVTDESLVRRLIREQCPELGNEPVRLHDEGWDNTTYRLGAEHAVRLPRREAAVELLLHEHTWLPTISQALDVDVPSPVHRGTPAAGYPWPWSVVPWIAGVTADEAPLAEGQGGRLGRILAALHRPAPASAPTNPFRGLPLAARDAFMTERLEHLGSLGEEVGPLRSMWRRGVEAPRHSGPRWLHGDLHPRNVIVRDGAIAGIIDWGDLCAGDPATDLAAAWTLLSAGECSSFWAEYGADDAPLRSRAGGWAVFFGVALATTEEERHRRMGVGIVERLRTAHQDP